MLGTRGPTHLNSVNILKYKIKHLNFDLKTHANNLSNANTPNYKSKVSEKFINSLKRKHRSNIGAQLTHHKHIPIASNAHLIKTYKRKDIVEQSPDGNTVNLEQESVESSNINDETQLSVSLYKKLMGMFKFAISGR